MELVLSNISSTLSILATIIYVIGLIFLIVEAFIPGFGFFGISGLSLIGISIVTKIAIGESIQNILWTLVIAFIIIIALLVWIIISAKKGLISKSPLMSQGTSIPTFYNDDDLKIFIGLKGETVTTCKPIGKIRLDNEIYEAQSLDGFLDIGTKIEVISVENNVLRISKIKTEENK